MPFKPPLTGPFGKPLLPAATRLAIDAVDSGVDPAAAVQLVQDNAGAINQFVAKQRLLYGAGVVQVAQATMSVNGVDIVYQNQFGRETLTFAPHPPGSPAPPAPETPETPETPAEQPPGLLAVKFATGDNNLALAASPIEDFTKAVMSIWFRVPQTSLDAAQAETGGDDELSDLLGSNFYPPLLNIVPVLTFGSLEAASTGEHPISPSFIGVNCATNPPTLAVNLQMSNHTTYSATPDNLGSIIRPDAFFMAGSGQKPYSAGGPTTLTVTADKWCHALVSFDLSKPTVSEYHPEYTLPGDPPPQFVLPGGPSFWWALDDTDHSTDWTTSPACAQIYNVLAPGSTFVTPTPVPMTQLVPNNIVLSWGGATGFTATWASTPVKSKGNPIGVPASDDFAKSILTAEVAEFQMFTGVTLDTSIESNRRLFITRARTPVDPSAPIKFFGKNPDISFTRDANNWLIGLNSGTAGKFVRTGKITEFAPNPKVGK